MRLVSLYILLSIFTQDLFAQKLKIAHQKDYYPYSWVNEKGQAEGILIDWWLLWGQKTDTEVEFIPGSTKECINMVIHDKADVIAGLFFQEALSDSLSYSEYLMRAKTVLYLRKDIRPESIDDLELPVGLLKDEISEEIVSKKFPELKIAQFDKRKDLKAEIENKSIAGFIYEYPNPVTLKNERHYFDDYYDYKVLHEDKFRPAVKSGNEKLLKKILIGNALITDQELLNIAEKYNLYPQSPPNSSYIIFIIIIIIGLVFIGIYWKRILQSKNVSEWEINKIQTLIEKGEDDHVEFKSSLRWDFKQEKINKVLEHVIAKTISAFLNSKGGILFIGIQDDGNIIGLEKDYSTLNKKNSDGFLLALANSINQYLGKKTHKFIRTKIIKLNNKEVCLVDIEKCDAPVFVDNNGKDEFFIRASASSQPMGMSEAFEYIHSHWPGKKRKI